MHGRSDKSTAHKPAAKSSSSSTSAAAGKRPRRKRKRSGDTIVHDAQLPQEILDRIDRVRAYHASSKHTYDSVRMTVHKLDAALWPDPFREFLDHPKVDLPPADELPAGDAPTLAVLAEGRAGAGESHRHPPQNLHTLAGWLTLANGITGQRRVGKHTLHLRSAPSSAALFPFEIYVAAFGVEGLEPGLYHYSVRERALRKLRDGHATLAQIKKGRPDLEFLKTVPAALLVSTIYCRSSWRYRHRGYRYAVIDAGHLVQNLITAADGLGIQTTTRLGMNDRNARALIGMRPDAPFGEAESVQAMVVWAEKAAHPIGKPAHDDAAAAKESALPPIERTPLVKSGKPIAYPAIVKTHDDCVAPGVTVREIRPPLTEFLPVPKRDVAAELPAPDGIVHGGPALRDVLAKRRSAVDFLHEPVPLAPFWQLNRLAFRGGSYFPVFPAGPHVGLVRPMWIVNDVDGLEPGVWHYHAADDRWVQHRSGVFRFESQYLCLEQAICGNASAVGFLLAQLNPLMDRGGPDTYRLAHLEAGIVAQRVFLAAGALGIGCTGVGPFYDDEVVKFLEPEGAGWEAIYSVALGVPKV